MGYELPDYPLAFADDTEFAGLKVTMGRLPIAESLRLNRLVLNPPAAHDDDEKVLAHHRAIAELVAHHLVEWNLEEDGDPVKPTAEELMARDLALLDALVTGWIMAINGGRRPLAPPPAQEPPAVLGLADQMLPLDET